MKNMALVINGQTTYKDLLRPTVVITSLFNSGAIAKARIARLLEKILFLVVFFALVFIAMFAVFARSGIDTWIQFSLYIVPLFSMVCGHQIFKSNGFKGILNRRIAENASIETERPRTRGGDKLEHLARFLRKRSVRTCFYPVSLVLYQWTVYLLFFMDKRSSEFSGPYNISEHSSYLTRLLDLDLKRELWLPLYYIFWTMGMYVTGFVGCCFILMVHIHKLDIKSFLCKVGEGPLVHKGNSFKHRTTPQTRVTSHGEYQGIDARIKTPVGLCFQGLSFVTGFLTLGLVELESRSPWKYRPAMPGEPHLGDEDIKNFGGEVSDSGIANGLGSSITIEDREGQSCSVNGAGTPRVINARDASRHLVQLMANIERNSSLFKPFLVLLTFFSVTNLVTHVVTMAILKINNFTDSLHWWTLARTLFWFLLAIRLLWSVAVITKTLARIIPHLYYLRSVGELTGPKGDWDDFFQLAETFQLGSKTYGFPLTLNQVASIVALVNFSLLIVLSLFSNVHD